MAKNEIKVNITAETTQFERNIASLKNKLGEAFLTPNQFSIGAAPNSSYTIGGRTFTKANLSELKKHLEPLAETLSEYLPSFRAIHRSTAPALTGVRF